MATNAQNATDISLPVIGIERHRLTTDGIGVTTLVGAYGCPLACKYCINAFVWNPETQKNVIAMTPRELYEKLKIDDLYFLATGGGVTFGGGESLLHADFIAAFREVCTDSWQLSVETSLNVPSKQLDKVIHVVNDFIVDIKDMNPEIYKAYTGKMNDQVLQNLKYLSENVAPEHVKIRIPSIPQFNTREDMEQSVKLVQKMGFTQLDIFTYRT